MTVDAPSPATDVTDATPTATRRAWTAAEDEDLHRLCGQGLSQRAIAAVLGRRASSVGCRMRVLGIEPRERRQRREPSEPQWPDWLRFEDDPRACRREAPWRGDPVAARSAQGCATALLENEA